MMTENKDLKCDDTYDISSDFHKRLFKIWVTTITRSV